MATPVLLQQLTLLLLLFSLLLRINSYITKPIGSRTRLSNIKSLFSSKELNDHRELIDDESKFRSALQVNGSLLSLEVYAGQKDSIDLVISQISNWARLESNCIQEFGYQSILFESVDKTRVIHAVTWQPVKSIKKIFDDFRKRGESEDGVPIALLESTHLYSVQNSFPTNIVSSFSSTNPRSYPFFSFDIFTCHTRDNHEKLSDTLYKAYSAADLESLPEFKGLHILGSTDLLVCIGMGIWGSVEDYHKMLANSNTRSELANTKKLAAEGTISDLVAKRPSQRLYYVVDVFKP